MSKFTFWASYRVHLYYLFGLSVSAWVGWNAFWAYVSGAEINERLEDLCDLAFDPKTVNVGEFFYVCPPELWSDLFLRSSKGSSWQADKHWKYVSDAASALIAGEAFIIHLLHRLYVSSRVSIFSMRDVLNPVDILLSLSFYAGAALSIFAESPDFKEISGEIKIETTHQAFLFFRSCKQGFFLC